MNTKAVKKTSQEDWHPERIKYELRLKGTTLTALAKKYGLKDSSSMSAALVRSNPANEQRIADELEIHPKEIWPSRYFDNGDRKPQGFHAMRCPKETRQAA
jgi:Ner family transcriptional regulator